MFRGTVLAALALVMVSGSAVGQATSEAVDPGAISAVVEMGKRLRALKSFSVEAEMSSDEVLETGEKLTHLEHVKADVKPPSGLRVARVSTLRERIFFIMASVPSFGDQRQDIIPPSPSLADSRN